MIKVANEIKLYEIDNAETAFHEKERLIIESHWNQPEFVVFKIGDHTFTVIGKDVISAIDNAMNTNRYRC